LEGSVAFIGGTIVGDEEIGGAILLNTLVACELPMPGLDDDSMFSEFCAAPSLGSFETSIEVPTFSDEDRISAFEVSAILSDTWGSSIGNGLLQATRTKAMIIKTQNIFFTQSAPCCKSFVKPVHHIIPEHIMPALFHVLLYTLHAFVKGIGTHIKEKGL
jgi:hypothetical protein